ncbi:hypothetical protein M406DRAFT_224993, partial [Cryphonectria parasitica EP155]
FCLKNQLLYNYDNNGKKRLIIPRSLMQKLLHDSHDDKYYFSRDCMIAELDSLYFRKKRLLISQYIDYCYEYSI